MEIVGVMGDLRYWGLEKQAPQPYSQPYAQNLPDSVFLVVRSAKPAAALAPSIEHEINSLDKDAVTRRVLTMQDLFSENVAAPRFREQILHRQHAARDRSEEHTSELQSPCNLVCRLLLEKKTF